ncbi:MAG: hypothetical protein P4M05_19555 [Bradyrhizobium sp.]|nr:hypothetical protein [Bradyrhizobium sp.]
MADPKSAAKIPILKNSATAPFVFFDSAPVFGTTGGIIEVELAASTVVLLSGNETRRDMTAVAHLKSSADAAVNLFTALGRALQMAGVNLPDLGIEPTKLNS